MDDVSLLKDYVDRQDQAAFAELVGRHGGWMYSAARRQLGDEHLAEDVSQAVFLLLSKRAKGITHTRLSGWLFLALGYCIRESKRRRMQQLIGEKEAASMRKEAVEEAKWEEVAPELDEAVRKLGKSDRDAVLLRFYEQRPLAEVGKTLGISEEAARKRVERAVEKLRGILAKKGVTGTTAGLSAVLVGNVVGQMPEHLVEKIVSAVGGGGGSTVAAAIAKGAMKMMTYVKVKVVGVVVTTGLLIGGTIAGVVAADGNVRPAQPRLVQAQKALDADLAALRQKGEPVTPQDLVQAPVPEADNAAADLRAAVKLFDTTGPTFDVYNKMDSIRLPLVEKDATSLRALVRGNQRALDLIRSAIGKEKVDWQIKYSSPMAGMLLADLSGQHRLASLVRAAALVAHEDGKDREALEHIRQLHFIAHATGRLPFLVCHRVELGIEDMAFDVCRQISSRLKLNGDPEREELRLTIAALLDEKDLRADLRWSLQSERVCHGDMAQVLAAKPTALNEMLKTFDSGDIWVHPADVGPVALEDCHLMLNTWQRYTDAIGVADWPTARERMNPWPPPEITEPGTHFFMKMMLPSLKEVFGKHYVAMAQRRLAASALAIRWYSLEHEGKFPESLDSLVPKYLPVVPADPFAAGALLTCRPENNALYSVGVDGKDDGGDPADDTPQNPDIVVPLR